MHCDSTSTARPTMAPTITTTQKKTRNSQPHVLVILTLLLSFLLLRPWCSYCNSLQNRVQLRCVYKRKRKEKRKTRAKMKIKVGKETIENDHVVTFLRFGFLWLFFSFLFVCIRISSNSVYCCPLTIEFDARKQCTDSSHFFNI